ncbi:MAG: GGDEF domain-containing protein [Nitratireductor sp.]
MAALQIGIVTPLMGEPYQASMFVNAVIGCYSIGTPVAFYCLRQNHLLKGVMGELEQAHAQLAEAHEQLSEKASRDDMTGFLNRENFFSVMETTRRTITHGAMLIVDADHFKKINDTWGHLKGDEALLLITNAIRKSLRNGDFVGRIGGEEFAVFLPGASERDAIAVGERIRTSVELLEFRPDGEIVPLTVSIGGATAGKEPTTSQLMRAADLRLYAAKRNGRNCTLMTTELVSAATTGKSATAANNMAA